MFPGTGCIGGRRITDDMTETQKIVTEKYDVYTGWYYIVTCKRMNLI